VTASSAASDWRASASCRGVGPREAEAFFTEAWVMRVPETAGRRCGGCAVWLECLAWALGRPPERTEDAVYGGLTDAQRRSLVAERRRCADCGLVGVLGDREGVVCRGCGLVWKV